jgi:hypothetical protein
MFERINTGSKNANTAEIRRGALAGSFLDVVMELANVPLLAQLAPISAKAKKERGYEELVTRFFAYGDGLENYRDRPSDFLFAYSKKMNEEFAANPALADGYRQRFNAVLDFVSRNFPFGFRKTEKDQQRHGRGSSRLRSVLIAPWQSDLSLLTALSVTSMLLHGSTCPSSRGSQVPMARMRLLDCAAASTSSRTSCGAWRRLTLFHFSKRGMQKLRPTSRFCRTSRMQFGTALHGFVEQMP